MSLFTESLVVTPMPDGKTWIILHDFGYEIGDDCTDQQGYRHRGQGEPEGVPNDLERRKVKVGPPLVRKKIGHLGCAKSSVKCDPTHHQRDQGRQHSEQDNHHSKDEDLITPT